MSAKQRISSNFYKQYKEFTETETAKFSKISSKLLDKNFLIRQNPADREDYFFVVGNLTLFQSYFMIMDYDVIHYEADQLLELKTTLNRNRVRLKKNETIILLILRLLYQKKAKEATQLEEILITISELTEEIDKTSLFKGRIPKTELQNILRIFKRYSLLNYQSIENVNDDVRIEIYPSLLRVVNIDDLERLEQTLSKYSTGGDEDEDDDED